MAARFGGEHQRHARPGRPRACIRLRNRLCARRCSACRGRGRADRSAPLPMLDPSRNTSASGTGDWILRIACGRSSAAGSSFRRMSCTSPAATRTVCSCALKRGLRPSIRCWPALTSLRSIGALPLLSPSTKTSTSASLAMMRKDPLDVDGPMLAATLACWPATTSPIAARGARRPGAPRRCGRPRAAR